MAGLPPNPYPPVMPGGDMFTIPMPMMEGSVAPPISPFAPLEELDIYAPPEPLKISATKYPSDKQGFLCVPMSTPQEIDEVCDTICKKLKTSPSSWTEVVANGLILKLVSKGKKPKNGEITYIPYHIAMEFFIAWISSHAEMTLTLDDIPFRDSETLSPNVGQHLFFLSEALMNLSMLQRLSNDPSQLLLRHSPQTQGNFLCILLKSMVFYFISIF